ncbi:MAG: protein translocase subunit SecF [Dongiaceae bacterium]
MSLRFIPSNTNINFFRYKWIAIGFSVLLTIISIVSLAGQGLNFGIDFRGGILLEVDPQQPVELSALRQQLNNLNLGEVALQEFGEQKNLLIRVQQQAGGEAAQMAAVNQIKESLGQGYDYRRVELVGPKVGKELIQAGALATGLSILGIVLYIWFRYEWQFGLNAMLATVHDVLTTLGLFSILQLEFNLTSVAAILTLAGYSINDTVVVYDRIRENRRKYRSMPLEELMNQAVNRTLSRTLMTSLTVFLSVLAIYFFGGEVLAGFALAILWGIFVGTYSSIYVASPLLLFFMPSQPKAEAV